MTDAQKSFTAIALGVAIASVLLIVFTGHTAGDMLDKAYYVLAGAALALFVK